MKLSKTQQEIIDLMKNGWELAHSKGAQPHAWIQKGGAGHGGESKNVSMSTVGALFDKKIIIINIDKYPRVTYKLNLDEKISL